MSYRPMITVSSLLPSAARHPPKQSSDTALEVKVRRGGTKTESCLPVLTACAYAPPPKSAASSLAPVHVSERPHRKRNGNPAPHLVAPTSSFFRGRIFILYCRIFIRNQAVVYVSGKVYTLSSPFEVNRSRIERIIDPVDPSREHRSQRCAGASPDFTTIPIIDFNNRI